MAKVSKRVAAFQAKVDRNKFYPIDEALSLVKEFATAKFDESIVPVLTKNKSALSQFMDVTGEQGADLAMKAFLFDFDKAAVRNGIIDVNAARKWLKSNSSELALLGDKADVIRKAVTDVTELNAQKVRINNAFTEARKGNLLQLEGKTAQDIVNNLYSNPANVDRFLRTHGSNIDTLNAVRSFMLDDILSAQNPVEALADRTRKATYDKVFGPTYAKNVENLAEAARRLSVNPADVKFNVKEVPTTPVEKALGVTPEEFIAAARELLGPEQSISAGTDLYFTEINRGSAVVPGIDQINFSLNPQVHSFDDRTLIQNLATQEVIALNAARIAGSKRISVGPITLRPRFNPNATQPDKDVSNTALPASVDSRQRTWFNEAWTAISIKYLAQSNSINSATYFESVGWRGIRESKSGSKDSVNFPSESGEAFPVWNLFVALKGFSICRKSSSSAPEVVDSLIIRNSETTRLILANFSSEAQQVHFTGIDLAPVVLPPTSTTYLDI